MKIIWIYGKNYVPLQANLRKKRKAETEEAKK